MNYLCNILTSLLMSALLMEGTKAACSNVTTWVSIPEDQYDRSYSNINYASARPLGYKVGRYVYDNQQSICVKVPDTKDRRVEVRFETEPAAVLCVKSNIGNDNEPACSTDKRQSLCNDFASDGDDSTTFEFYCTGECAEADVTFWYRFTVCPYANSNDCEQWCFNRPTDEYPGNLLTVPFMTTQPTERPVGASSRLSTLISGYVVSVICLLRYLQ